jgi:hypothetical protein
MQNNIGTIKIIKTSKLLDLTKPKYAPKVPWKRGVDKRQEQNSK